MRPYDIILKKRNGEVLSKEEINFLVNGYVKGDIMDYQISAFLMAVYFRKMNMDETVALTEAMINSGETINLSLIKGIKIDKHSTGGVGDKTSIVLAPLVASVGIPVAKLSGRGLGHTGGTIDKLESIAGFHVNLTKEKFIENVNKIGIAIGGQTSNLVPADKKFYALRDVTATIENNSLIAASIMSKKLASGADAIVLDVKCGNGAFMNTADDAFELAQIMVKIGECMGKKTEAVVTDMSQPLGNSIGNSLEVIESIETLQGKGPHDLKEICFELGATILTMANVCNNKEEAITILKNKINSGEAFKKFKEFIKAQGGNIKMVENTELFPKANFQNNLICNNDGYIENLFAKPVGMASLALGAGRTSKESKIDLFAGIQLFKKTGEKVNKGEYLATLYYNDKSKINEAMNLLKDAFVFSDNIPQKKPMILGHVSSKGIFKTEYNLK